MSPFLISKFQNGEKLKLFKLWLFLGGWFGQHSCFDKNIPKMTAGIKDNFQSKIQLKATIAHYRLLKNEVLIQEGNKP